MEQGRGAVDRYRHHTDGSGGAPRRRRGDGANPREVDDAVAALLIPEHVVDSAVIDLGERVVSVGHADRGHTDDDLIAVVAGAERTAVF
ncbi:MAG: hypothetical protein ACXWZR_20360, partial [Mycobacterium sp.]